MIPIEQEAEWALEPVRTFRREEKPLVLPGTERQLIQPLT
jgi:hypothetical protein